MMVMRGGTMGVMMMAMTGDGDDEGEEEEEKMKIGGWVFVLTFLSYFPFSFSLGRY
jgi:hypothetical protein